MSPKTRTKCQYVQYVLELIRSTKDPKPVLERRREKSHHPSRPPRNLRPLNNTPPGPRSHLTITTRRRRRSNNTTNPSRTRHDRPPHHRRRRRRRRLRRLRRTSADLDFPSASPGGVVEFCFSLALGGGTLPVCGHLGLDFHAAVEFLFGYAAFAVGVAFFFDRVEDAA